MKKILYAACALFAMASCAKTDEALTVDSENLVRLSSSIEGVTRVIGLSWESTDAIGVTIFKRGETFTSGDNVNIKYVPETAGASVDFEAADPLKALYFPHEYGTMDFVAYYPYNENFDGSSYDLDGENTEVLFALTDNAVKGKPVALQFKSPYSQIKVNLKSSDESIKSFDGAQITLKDVVTQGTYDVLSGESNIGEEIQDLTYDASASGYILPQDFTPSFEISLVDDFGNYKVAASEQLQAKENTIYSYTVDITLNGITISGSIEDLLDKEMDNLEPEQVGRFMLADFVAGLEVPASINTWIIDNEDATADDESDFAGLRAALDAAADDTREIKLIFPNLTAIPWEAFKNSKIQSISAPNVTTVNLNAFNDCNILTSVDLPAATTIVSLAFDNCDVLKTVFLPAATSIGNYAFGNCDLLTTVDLPAATTIGNYAFRECGALMTVNLPAATTIGNYAFYYCDVLKTIDLPAATTINKTAFYNCDALETLNIGYDEKNGKHATVTSIDPTWLDYANEPENINISLGYLADSNIEVDDENNTLTFNNNPTNPVTQTFATLTLAGISTTLNAFESDANANLLSSSDTWVITDYDATADNESDFAGLRTAVNAAADEGRKISLDFPNLTTIPQDAFYDRANVVASKIQSISAPKVTTIGNSAFKGCSLLTSVDIPLVEQIESNAFYDCASLKTVDFPKATEIGSSAFSGCSALSSVNLPLLEEVEGHVFENCISLTSVKLPKATTIGNSAFNNCNMLTDITLPQATEIGEYAFRECDVLTNIDLPKTTTIKRLGFANNNAIKTLKIGYDESNGHATVTSIDPDWLASVNDLTETTLYIGLWSDSSNFSIEDNTLTLSNGTEQVFSRIIQADNRM